MKDGSQGTQNLRTVRASDRRKYMILNGRVSRIRKEAERLYGLKAQNYERDLDVKELIRLSRKPKSI
jgi:hypothetical protein